MNHLQPVLARSHSRLTSIGARLCLAFAALAIGVTARAQDFQITSLTTNNALAVEMNALTGDDRGGIAVSGSQVFLTGDAATARIGRTNLTGGVGLGVVRDGLVANLHTETVYLLANGVTPIVTGGGTVNALLELDGATGVTNGRSITLSASIPLTGASASVGIFSGWDRIVLHNGTTVYHISLPSGTVTTLGTMGIPTRTQSESWAYWGVAENVGSDIRIVYVQSGTAIARTLVPAGTTTTVATFANLNDMASFTVSVPLGRWYFHHEGTSQFGSRDETLGYADATFISPPAVPFITQQPVNVTVLPTEPASFSVDASGSLPLTYQWKKNGTNIAGATSATFSFTTVTEGDAGTYSVGITNAFGGLVSSNATLTVSTLDLETFKVRTLTTNNLITVNPSAQTGDDRGGIAASDTRVFLRGDEYTGSFGVTNLSGASRVQVVSGVLTNFPGYEALASDLRTAKVYLLANGTTPLGINGGTVTRLLELDATSGLTNGNFVALDTPVVLPGAGLYTANVGILAGWGRIGLHTGTNLFSVRLSDGAVTNHGAMSRPSRVATESWAYWGLLENWGGNYYVVHTRDAQSIVRTRVPDGVVATVATFNNLNDMANFTVGVTNGRWFFHNESVSQFSANPNYGEELIGMADAAFIYQPPAPTIVSHPTNLTVTIGTTATFNVAAIGTPPLFYQWRKGGVDLLNQTNTTLVLNNAQLTDAGNYTAFVSNLSGNATSSNAVLTVVTNAAPTLNPLAAVNILEDAGVQTVSLSGIGPGAAHEGGQTLTVSAVSDNPSLVETFGISYAGLTTGTLSFTTLTNANGTAVISVIVTDNGGTAAGGVNAVTNSFVLTVTNVNDAPVVLFPTNNLVVREADYSTPTIVSNNYAIVHPGATNEFGQGLTLTITNSNPFLFLSQPTLNLAGNLSFALQPYLFGTNVVTVVAHDDAGTNYGGADTTVATLTITVLSVNNQPVVSVRPGQNGPDTVVVLEDSGPQRVTNWLQRYSLTQHYDPTYSNSIPVYPGAPNETNQTFSFFILTNNNPSLFVEGPAINPDGILTFTPAKDVFGTAFFQFYVMDSGGTNFGGTNISATNFFSIRIAPVNDPPTMLLTDGSAPGVVDGSFEGAITFSTNYFTNAVPPGWTVTNLGSVAPYPAIAKVFRTFGYSGFGMIAQPQLFHGMNAMAQPFCTLVPGGETNRMYQEITVTAAKPVLSFSYEVAWDMTYYLTNFTKPRVFRVSVQPVGGGAALLNVPVVTALPQTTSRHVDYYSGFPDYSQGVKLGFVDLAAFAGQRVRLCFDWEVPEPDPNTFNIGATSGAFLMDDVRMVPASRSITSLTMNEDETRTVYLSGVSFGPRNELAFAYNYYGNGILVTNVLTATSSDTNVIRDVVVVYTNILSGTAQLHLVPAPRASGTAVITVIANDMGSTLDGGVAATTNTFTVTVNPVNDAPVMLTNQVDVFRSTPGGLVAFGSFTNSSTPLNNGGFETGDLTGWINYTDPNVQNVRVLTAGETIFPAPLTNAPTEGGRGLAAFIPQSFYLAQDVTISSNQPVLRFDYRLAWNRQDSTPIRPDGTNVPGTFEVVIEQAGGSAILLASNLVFSMPEGTRNEDTGPRFGSVDLSAFAGTTVRVAFRAFNSYNYGYGPLGISLLLDNVRLASSLPAVTLLEDGGPYVLAFPGTHAGSPEESAQVLTASASSGNTALLPAPVASLANTNFPAGTLSLTLGNVANANGSGFVTATLRDNGGTANGGVDGVTNTFFVTFLPVNDPPSITFTTNNVSVLEDSSAFTGTIIAGTSVGPTNENYQTVTNLVVVGVSNPSLFSVQPAVSFGGTLTFTPATNAVGTATVTVLVQDDGGTANGGVDFSTNSFTITLRPVNDAPRFTFLTGSTSASNYNAFAWGDNNTGALGLGSNGPVVNLPAAILNAAGFTKVAAGYFHSLALKADGTVWAWGDNTSGQLGDGTGTSTFVPVQVQRLTNVAAIAAGSGHSLAALADGTVWAWGNNSSGELGIGTNVATNAPVQVVGLTSVVAVAAGYAHSLALKADGTVWAWGENIAGQLGNSTTTATNSPVQVSGLTNVTGIAAGDSHSLAVKSNGTLWTWGENDYGQLGDGTEISTNAPVAVLRLTNIVSVAAGYYHSLAMKSDGTAWAWGDNFYGQLGDGSDSDHTNAPVAVLRVTGVSAIVGGNYHSMALKSDGTLWAWGDNYYGQLGSSSVIDYTNAAVLVSLGDVVAIAAGCNHSLAIVLPTVSALEGSGPQTVPNLAANILGGPTADENSQTVTFAVTNSNPALFSVQPYIDGTGTATPGALHFTPAAVGFGRVIVTVVARDNAGTTNGGVDTAVAQTFIITIVEVNTRVFISATTPAGRQGETLTVPILFKATGAESGVGFTLNFDSTKLTYRNTGLGANGSGATLTENATGAGSGRLGFVLGRPVGDPFSSGTNELLLVTFAVNPAAALGSTPVTFTDATTRREITDASANTMPFVFVDGSVTIATGVVGTPSTLEGDVSSRPYGNGSVSVSDAIQIGRFAAGLDTPSTGTGGEFQRADCAPLATKGNGVISVADYVQAIRFAAGLDTPGTVGGPTTVSASLHAPAALPAGARTVRVVSGSLVAGRVNSITVQLDSQGNESGISLSLNFDPTALAYVGATTGSGASGGSLTVNSLKAAAGKVGFVLAMPAGSTIAAGTQTILTLSFNVTGTGTTAISLTGDSPVVREIADVNAEVLGASYVNGSFNVILPAGLNVAGIERAADGSPRLVVRNVDGTPVTAAQAAKYQVYVTANLGGAWTLLPNALIVENGALKILDPAAGGAGLRLYKLVEAP